MVYDIVNIYKADSFTCCSQIVHGIGRFSALRTSLSFLISLMLPQLDMGGFYTEALTYVVSVYYLNITNDAIAKQA